MNRNMPNYDFCNDQKFDEQIKERLESLKNDYSLPIGFSGNPFVDAGLIAVSAIQKKEVHEVTLGDLIDVFRSIGGQDTLGTKFAERNAATKASFMIFPNNPLTQSAYGKAKTDNPCLKKPSKGLPSALQKNVYRAYLTEFIYQIPKEKNSENICISCGRETTLDFNELELRLEEIRTGMSSSKKFGRGVTKSWFPLVGTIGNEAQAMPAFSEPQMICARCLFLVHFLPQITHLMQGKLVVYQSDNFAISRKLVKSNLKRFEDIFNAANLDTTIDIIGKKDPPGHIIIQLLDILRQYTDELKGSTLIIWKFSNSNQGSECETLFLPDRTLNFIRALSLKSDFDAKKEIERFVNSEQKLFKHPSRFLLARMVKAEDYEGFYVKSNVEPPNIDFYNFYQMYFLGWTRVHLSAVKEITDKLKSNKKPKDLNRIYKEWNTRNVLDQVFPIALKLQFSGKIKSQVLLDLFFSENIKGERRNFLALLKFYLHPKQQGDPNSKLKPKTALKRAIPDKIQDKIGLVSLLMDKYIKKRKIDSSAKTEKFLNEVARYSRENIRNIYLSVSKELAGLTFETYHQLLEGIKRAELLYLFRIVTVDILQENKSSINYQLPKIQDFSELVKQSGLSEQVCNSLVQYAKVRETKIGKKRFFREMDGTLKEGKINSDNLMNQINERLQNELEEPMLIPESDWFDAGVEQQNFSWKFLRFKLRIFFYQFRIWTETTTTKEE